ncbi:MAG TPA: hypothetical protein VKW08_20760 [Xanthobacteraceae bacterium]|jgi:hypothetical protein|nr:hypothetical protein [Xanthobacteraceae bacterium]
MKGMNSLALAAALMLWAAAANAQTFDLGKYPDFSGQWNRIGVPRWIAPGEKAPLTAEYQQIFEANLKDQANGGPGDWPSTFCIPQGMPAMMNLYDPMEIVVTPEVTYILISHVNDSYRRIYTDGRDWPPESEIERTYAGYSIGRWIDSSGSGRFDRLEIETRYLRGPRGIEASGLPTHHDNQSIIKEVIHLDPADPDVILDELTLIDHALTRPWTSVKKARRERNPVWASDVCPDDGTHVRIGKDTFYLSADGKLMPTRKGEPPPDLSYFPNAERAGK